MYGGGDVHWVGFGRSPQGHRKTRKRTSEVEESGIHTPRGRWVARFVNKGS